MKRKLIVAASVALLAITVAYSNYFLTDLHFGDYPGVRDNPAIRSVTNIPRFFFDSSTASTNPAEYVYRPVVTTSLAIDYLMGKGTPFFYHFITFVIFLAGLATIGWLFFLVFENTAPHPWNPYLAILATALLGMHPAVAELLNPVSHRGELFADLGVVAGVALYAGLPHGRRFGLYLIPPMLGVLAHPSGLIFGPLLLVYILLIEPAPAYENETPSPNQTRSRDETQSAAGPTSEGTGSKRIRIRRRKHPLRRYLKAQLTRFMPALVFTALASAFESLVNPTVPLGDQAISYWFTQPWVAMRYFRSFFAPFYLSPASDLAPFGSYHIHAVWGVAFLLVVFSVALLLAVSPRWRPAVFGLCWFMIGILPGAIFPQADVESDTRLFLPFIGLVLSVSWTARMLLPGGEPLRRLEAIVAAALILTLGYAAHVRNRVWADEETLWGDTIKKNPRSVRGLQYYALTLESKGRGEEAYEYLRRALRINPASAEVEAYLGWVAAAIDRTDEADEHFHRAISLAADQPISHFLYATWLEKQGRRTDAIEAYSWASSLAPTDLRPRYGMMRLYSAGSDWNNLRKVVHEAQEVAPGDPGVVPFAAIVRNHPDTVKAAELLVKDHPTPENYITLSDAYCLAGEFLKCLNAAQKALELQPGYVAAYNNMGAAYISLGRLEEAIASVKKALELDPDNKIAHANMLEWENEKLVVGDSIMRK